MKGLLIGLVDSLVVGALRRLSYRGRSGETFTDRRFLQHYGFQSAPLADCEVVVLQEGGVVVIVAEEDRRYRLALQGGEVALSDDQGQKIHLQRDGKIEISGCTELNLGGVRANLKRLIDERVVALFNGHVHTCAAAGNPSSAPTAPLVLTEISTDVARAK